MEGWILYSDWGDSYVPEVYEVKRLIDVAANRGIDIKVFKPEQFDLYVTRDDRKSIMIDSEPVTLPNFFLPRMGANTMYFAFAVIRQMERLGVHVVNSSESIANVKDKLYSQQILAQSNMPVPNTMLVKYPVNIELVEKYLGFPVVVKTISGTQGVGVYLCENKANFEDIMRLIEATNSKTNIILQEFIEDSKGRDIRVFVIGGRPVACMKRSATDGGLAANYSKGGVVEAYPMNSEIKWLAAESARILGLDIAGIDLLFDGDHFKICEANSAPGFKGIESCCDISIPDEMFDYISLRHGLHL